MGSAATTKVTTTASILESLLCCCRLPKLQMNRIVILYGTETFNSYEYAVLLANKLELNNYPAVVYSMDDFELKKLLEIRVLIVIASTFGNGDNPRNTKKFWRFLLQKRLPRDFLDHIEFTTFGLGDSSYPRYNFFIRKLHTRLMQLGAKEVSLRGEGDEQNPEGVEAFYKEWEALLVQSITARYTASNDLLAKHEIRGPGAPKYRIEVAKNKFKRDTVSNLQEVSISRVRNVSDDDKDEERIRVGQIMCNDRITSEDHFQDVRHLTIRDTKGGLSYRPGDTVSLYPTNDPADVDELINSQGWAEFADYKISISKNTGEYNLNIEGGLVAPLTLRSLITHHLDINSIPRRSFFMAIYKFAGDEREREKLQEFSELESTQSLYDYADRPRRSILETVTEFVSLKIPVEYVLDVFPILRPRLFSIASGPSTSELDLCVAIVKYKTIIKRIRKGVCTNWLKDLKPGDRVIFSIKKSNVYGQLVRNAGLPLLLIGPGTGIAPVRSVIRERLGLEGSAPELHLFTGNRTKEKDFLYGEYFEALSRVGSLNLYPSFSRDDTLHDGKKIKYVQDMVYYHREIVYDALVRKRGIVYLCGLSGRMPIQTRVTIQKVIEEVGKMTSEEAGKVLLGLENEYRYLQETW